MRRLSLKAFTSALAPLTLGAFALAVPFGVGAFCPDTTAGTQPSTLVGYSYAISTTANPNDTTTYKFYSLVNTNPVDTGFPGDGNPDTPGLIQYCVYPAVDPDSFSASGVTGANGLAFVPSPGIGLGHFGFVSSGVGFSGNIPLDGTSAVTGEIMGSAKWNAGSPGVQAVLLEIADQAECDALYPDAGRTLLNCFVIPTRVEAGGEGAVSRITTEIHLGATDGTAPIVVGACNVTPSSIVHDSADCTTTPPTPAPTGSIITFNFYSNASCGGNAVHTASFNVSGQTDPSIDPALAQGPLAPGGYSYRALFTSGDESVLVSSISDCEPFHVFAAALTPGYWKNHLAPITSTCPSNQGCSKNGPWTKLPQTLGTFAVASTGTVTTVFNGMNCSNSSDQNAVGCLAGHLLATKFNLANNSDTCISLTVAEADAFLVSIGYNGPTGVYSLSASQRATAISLKSTLDAYNNGAGCSSLCQ